VARMVVAVQIIVETLLLLPVLDHVASHELSYAWWIIPVVALTRPPKSKHSVNHPWFPLLLLCLSFDSSFAAASPLASLCCFVDLALAVSCSAVTESSSPSCFLFLFFFLSFPTSTLVSTASEREPAEGSVASVC
jgi:hypothetical protein